jgi:hypothetical protein
MGNINVVFDELLDLTPIKWEDTTYFRRRQRSRELYPPLLPGNILPRKAPSYEMFVLYEVLRSRNVRYSIDRLIKMSSDIKDVNNIVRKFIDTVDFDAKESLYVELAKLVAEYYNIDFKYDATDYGNLVRVWKKSGASSRQEYNFPMRRGVHKIRPSKKVDYSKYLSSDKRFLKVSEVGDIRKRALKKLK